MKPRLLLFVTDLKIGGTPTVVRELAIRLRARGHDVQVACLSPLGPVADQLRNSGVRVTALRACCAGDLRVIPKFVRLLREEKITHVLSFLVHANVVAGMASCWIKGVGSLCSNQRLPTPLFWQAIQTTQEKPEWHWVAQRIIASRAERIIVPSQAVARVARERSHIPAEKIVVIPNAIDPAEFPRVEVFKGKRVRLGFLGRLDPVKNVGALIRAMQWLEDVPVDAHIFGEGSERGRLENLVEQLRLKSRVFFHGAVRRPQEALAQMDVLVFPSIGEGFGLVLIEAMASGVPVIAANSGAIAEIVRHESNGLLVDASHAELDIGPAVRRLMDDATLREGLIANGFETIRSFSWEGVLATYERVLNLRGTGY